MENWKFEWIEGHDSVSSPAFLTRWQALLERSPDADAFQHPLVVRAWLSTRGMALGRTPAFCWAADDPGHEVLIPFCRLQTNWRQLWRRELLGAGQWSFGCPDLLAAAPDGEPIAWDGFWAGLARELRRRGIERASLPRLRARPSPACGRVMDAVASASIPLTEHHDLDSFLRERSRDFAANTRRRMRRLAELGEVDFHVYAPHEHEGAAEELHRLRAAFERRWAGQAPEVYFQHPGAFPLYQRLVEWTLPCGMLHFSVQRVGGRPVSWQFALLHRNVLHGCTIAFDLDFAKYSPGSLHMARIVELGIQSGWKEFDLGYGPEGYKTTWTDTARPWVEWHWSAETRRDHALQWARQAAQPVRKMISALPTHGNHGVSP